MNRKVTLEDKAPEPEVQQVAPVEWPTDVPKLTREQAAIVGAYTGHLASTFSVMHEYAEKVMGRPVWTHEFGTEEVASELSDKAKADFIAICYDGE